MLFALRNVNKGLFKRIFELRTITIMQRSSYLIDESKYSFLKDLDLQRNNLGVYDGEWKASGEVSIITFPRKEHVFYTLPFKCTIFRDFFSSK